MLRDPHLLDGLVAAAQSGDSQALDHIVADSLPLVYNIVGRAVGGRAETDDIVQETMTRVVSALAGLRDPAAYRSWLIAIAMNEVRNHWEAQQRTPAIPIEAVEQTADPTADFVDLAILRLGLSGQRREAAEAGRWLDQDDRALLALWWLETAGTITRAELAEATGLSPQHSAVKVQRMKHQLETCRIVVRALTAEPCCPDLTAMTRAWDGRPAALWRKRIARHVRDCPHCAVQQRGLMPAEGLLASIGILIPASGFEQVFPALPQASATAAAPAAAPQGTTDVITRKAAGGIRRRPRAGHPASVVAAMGTAALIIALFVLPDPKTPAPTAAPPVAIPVTSPSPSPVATPTSADTVAAPPTTPIVTAPTTPTVTAPTTPTVAPPTTPTVAAPPPAPSPPAPAPASTNPASSAPPVKSLEQQLIDLINAERARHGCAALTIDRRIHTAAQKHSEDMAARHYFDHASPENNRADSRLTAEGYPWSRWAENLDHQTNSPATVFNDWASDAPHLNNMTDCRLTAAGVGTAPAPDGMLWTLDLAAPR
ncbi:sigma-70 family RNA polymerase sigma factor (plasmid) [Kitasatospora sp. NBC_00070]|uniref:sigma-70 family RNA polymerase sigma factor n=1 Tax=Kitasatospora sp. NBC_00070 TaxID=2975962 RepID=UPI002F915E90